MVKIMRKIRKNKSAGVATYALIMFGMIFMLYLFGFSSVWSSYASDSSLETTSSRAVGVDILSTLMSVLSDNMVLLGGVVATGAAAFFARWIFGGEAVATILTYAVPILLLVAMNIFIFPLNDLAGTLVFIDATGFVITVFLFGFFNLFFILAVLEFIRGNI